MACLILSGCAVAYAQSEATSTTATTASPTPTPSVTPSQILCNTLASNPFEDPPQKLLEYHDVKLNVKSITSPVWQGQTVKVIIEFSYKISANYFYWIDTYYDDPNYYKNIKQYLQSGYGDDKITFYIPTADQSLGYHRLGIEAARDTDTTWANRSSLITYFIVQ